VADVGTVARDTTSLRLVAKARNLPHLETLPALERLWCFDLGAPGAAIVARLGHLRRLYIDGCRLATLEALTRLTGLELLSIDRALRIASFEEFRPFAGLRGLAAVHFPRVQSLAPLAELRSLTALAVAGGMWSRMKVDSLAPIGSLTTLQHLHLTNLKPADESLEPLAGLTALKTLDLANFYPVEEFARLSVRLPHTHCQWFAPLVPMGSVPCGRCGESTMVILTGKGMPMLCSRCDELRVRKHQERFSAAAAAASAAQ
jgi:hypothetical protein